MRRSMTLGAVISASVRASASVGKDVSFVSFQTMLSPLEITAVPRNSSGETATAEASNVNPLYVSGMEISSQANHQSSMHSTSTVDLRRTVNLFRNHLMAETLVARIYLCNSLRNEATLLVVTGRASLPHEAR